MSMRKGKAKLEKMHRLRYFTKKNFKLKVPSLALLTSSLTFHLGFSRALSDPALLGIPLFSWANGCLSPCTCCSLPGARPRRVTAFHLAAPFSTVTTFSPSCFMIACRPLPTMLAFSHHHTYILLSQWVLSGGDFVPRGTCGNVQGYFWLLSQLGGGSSSHLVDRGQGCC